MVNSPEETHHASTVPMISGEIDEESFSTRPSNHASPLLVPVTSINDEDKSGSNHTSRDSKIDTKGMGEVVVLSGGSGYNELVGATPGATYVMPISDDGGSSSEIIRVLGGPSIGDLRSRLVRLIPTSSSYSGRIPPPKSNDALHALLSYRLPTVGKSREIKQEWMDILEGRHQLWRGIEPERKECIRGFLVHFESEILRRTHRNFDFRGGSIGNFFLAAAQKFFRSIQSAIFLFSATALIHVGGHGGKVVPVINTNHTATIAAVLENGKVVVGQCEISHPVPFNIKSDTKETRRGLLSQMQSSGVQTPASAIYDPIQSLSAGGLSSRLLVGTNGDGLDPGSGSDSDEQDADESDGNSGAAHEAPQIQSRRSNIVFSKQDSGPASDVERSLSPATPAFDSRIARLFYVNAYGNEVNPTPNPEYLACLSRCSTLLYSCGSLWTSIVPCLALRGVASAITASPSLRYKILLLNTTPDRETSGYDALDFVRVLARSMQHSDEMTQPVPLHSVVTHIVSGNR